MIGMFVLLLGLQSPASRDVTLGGTVVTLAEAIKPLGITAVDEPTTRQVVLKGDDGTITPLLSDEASRAFFLDARLRDRKAELKARRFEGLPYVQVISSRVEHEGRLRTPEYYCDVCSITVRAPQECSCCQGPMVLRMRPEP